MILNDKPNCQVSKILMNPRPILSDSSENDPIIVSGVFFDSNKSNLLFLFEIFIVHFIKT
jgi:hypothetical protein